MPMQRREARPGSLICKIASNSSDLLNSSSSNESDQSEFHFVIMEGIKVAFTIATLGDLRVTPIQMAEQGFKAHQFQLNERQRQRQPNGDANAIHDAPPKWRLCFPPKACHLFR
jgi:uncharacterized protein YdgA (DUF945 family)